MRTNITSTERAIRFIVGIVLFALYLGINEPLSLKVLSLAVSGPLFLTALIGFCPVAEVRRVKVITDKIE